MRSGILSITNIESVKDGIRFTLIIHTSQGGVYTAGWRLLKGRLFPPAFPLGGKRYKPIQRLPKNLRSMAMKLAVRALIRMPQPLSQPPLEVVSSESPKL